MTRPNPQMQECIRAAWDCRHICQDTLFHHCLPIGGIHMEEAHAKLMFDCIQICQTAADFMSRDSSMHEEICAACADICDACAKTCETIGDEAMVKCAKACRKCAELCRKMGKISQAA